jgi:uncharacterized membrane protein YdjX (TVP38/TMEM64 family)
MSLYKLVRYLVAILVFAALFGVFAFRNEIDITGLESWLAGHPTTAPLLFIAIYAILVPLFFPSTLLALMGGALFGPFWGTLYNEISAILGAMLCFVIARYLSANWMERKIPANLKHLKFGVEKGGWRFVFMVRLIPWVPYALLNYALGVTNIRFLSLAGITALCILPRVVAYAYIGHAGHMALTGKETIGQLLLLVPLGLAVIFLPYLMPKVRRILKG